MIKEKFLPILLVASMFSSNVYAQSPPVKQPTIPSPDPEPEEKARISPLFVGDVAPFTGILFSTRATATVLAEIDAFPERLDAEVKKSKKEAEAQKKFELSELDARTTREKLLIKADLEAEQKLNKKLKEDVKRLEDEVSNSPSRAVWAGLGAAGGILVTVLITFAVNSASK